MGVWSLYLDYGPCDNYFLKPANWTKTKHRHHDLWVNLDNDINESSLCIESSCGSQKLAAAHRTGWGPSR